MSATSPPTEEREQSHAERVQGIIDDCLRRAAAGEVVNVLELFAVNSDLPELPAALRKVALVQRAARVGAQAARDPEWQTGEHAGSSSGLGFHLDASMAFAPPEAAPPTIRLTIPGYEIEQLIGSGGQGFVYEAVQSGTKRRVAIKLLHDGRQVSASSTRRFERELELVGALRHPGIVDVLHAGQTADGRLFSVMEYCGGRTITQYLTERRPELNDTLEMLAKVCDAVHHAHVNGIIHRDLKPGNILVVDEEGSGFRVQGSGDATSASSLNPEPRTPNPQPKVLDFGLARHVRADRTTFSREGNLIGTLAYMAPEQAAGEASRVDMRTDVYALGVVFYEALTGGFPYPISGQITDVLAHIQTTLARDLRDPCGRSKSERRGDWGRTAREFSTDLCTVLAKTLAKEPERRYQSAAELGEDLRRVIRGEAIAARRDNVWYVARKAMHRYRGRVAVGALVVAALATAGFAWNWQRLMDERRLVDARNLVLRQARLEPLDPEPIEFLRQALQDAWGRIAAGNAGPDELGALADAMVRIEPQERRVRAVIGETDDPYRPCERYATGWAPPGYKITFGATDEKRRWETDSYGYGLVSVSSQVNVRFMADDGPRASTGKRWRELATTGLPVAYRIRTVPEFAPGYPERLQSPRYSTRLEECFRERRAALLDIETRNTTCGTREVLRVEFSVPATTVALAFDVILSLPDGSWRHTLAPFPISRLDGELGVRSSVFEQVQVREEGDVWHCRLDVETWRIAGRINPLDLLDRDLVLELRPSLHLARVYTADDYFQEARISGSIRLVDERSPEFRAAGDILYPRLLQATRPEEVWQAVRSDSATSQPAQGALTCLAEQLLVPAQLEVQCYEAAHEKGRDDAWYQRAEEFAKACLRDDPHSIAFRALARAQYQLGRDSDALETLRRLEQERPREGLTVDAIAIRALASFRIGDHETALAALEALRAMRANAGGPSARIAELALPEVELAIEGRVLTQPSD